jgi:hypothetical protein
MGSVEKEREKEIGLGFYIQVTRDPSLASLRFRDNPAAGERFLDDWRS